MLRFLLALALFFIIANPATFKLTRQIFGGAIASTDGLATQVGVLVHALVFVFVSRLLMRGLSRYADEEKYEDEKYEDEKYEEEKEKYEEEKYEEEKYTPSLLPGNY